MNLLNLKTISTISHPWLKEISGILTHLIFPHWIAKYIKLLKNNPKYLHVFNPMSVHQGPKKTRKTRLFEPALRENTKIPEWKRTWTLHFQKSEIGPVDLTIVLSISGRKCYESFLFVCGLQEVKKINHWPLICRQFTVCYLFIALRSNVFILLLWNFDSENLIICDIFLYIAQGARGHTRDVAWSRKRTKMSSAPAIISQTLQFWCKWRNLKYVLCFLYAIIHWRI